MNIEKNREKMYSEHRDLHISISDRDKLKTEFQTINLQRRIKMDGMNLDLKEQNKGKSITALVFGIVSVIPCFGPIAFISGIVAIVLGVITLKKSEKQTGRAGLITGIIGTIISGIILLICIISVVAGILAPQLMNILS